MPGRAEQRERQRKRSAQTCQSILTFIHCDKKSKGNKDEELRPNDPSSSAEPDLATVDVDPKDDSESEANEELQLNEPSSSAEPDPATVDLEDDSERRSQGEANEELRPNDPSSSAEPDLATVDVDPKDDSESEAMLYADIGDYIKATSTPAEIEAVVNKMSSREKYTLLKKHRRPGPHFKYPSHQSGQFRRSFQHNWLNEHPWMVYSQPLDGAYCISCVLFCKKRSMKGNFVNAPFTIWHKKSEKCREHEHALYHHDALLLAEQFIESIEKPASNISTMVDARKAANVERNRRVVKTVAEALLFCGRQCIAIRGDNEKKTEDSESEGNPGNFLSLLKLMSNYDPIMKEHLSTPSMRNATYIYPRIQNEILEILGRDFVLQSIVNEIKEIKFFSVMADEVTSHNTEHLALCVRFVDAHSNIREEFLQFIRLTRITGDNIAREILRAFRELDLDPSYIRGQGYDGAANMSSSRIGVQAKIKEVAPLATYIHCSGHCLNLVICHTCALPQVRNVIDRLKDCCRFFLLSPKRSGLLQEVVKHGTEEGSKRKVLLDLCRTRWAERHSAYQHFYQAYVYIVEALEVIGLTQNGDIYPEFADWDTGNRSDARQILSSITSFDFIITFLIIYHYMAHLAGITVKLQSRTIDVIQAYSLVADTMHVYTKERENIVDSFKLVYDHAVRMAEKIGITPSMPRIAKRQQHRSNTPATSACDYYRINTAVPFLDHLTSDLEAQFSSLSITAISLLSLVPSVICGENVINAEEMVRTYADDLPSPELAPHEIKRWKIRYENLSVEKRPTTPASAIKECDMMMYPNVYILLQLACTLPVTSCECERSASTLRRLNNYMRASMGKERLSHLALLHIHYTKHIDLDQVVDRFARKHSRRLELETLL